jgi:ABC-type multidrug transport system fused ATPase/permease subunit
LSGVENPTRILPINCLNTRQWKSQVNYFGQEAFLFEGTIRENLNWGHGKRSNEEIWTALEKVHAADFVRKLPRQLESLITHSGANFSGGQKQRLALARAFLRPSSLLILDEATSHLDAYHQTLLLNTLLALKRTTTILVVSHSEWLLTGVDGIIELDDGHFKSRMPANCAPPSPSCPGPTESHLGHRCSFFLELSSPHD